MAEASLRQTIGPTVVLMGAAAVAVPVFRKLGLGSVLGYFAAGILVGPSALGLFTDAQSVLHVSELGVVMFLFVIGLELRPHKLWAMRAEGLRALGYAQADIEDAANDIRRRDAERFCEQVQGNAMSGRDRLYHSIIPRALAWTIGHETAFRVKRLLAA